jgi:thiol-disulfide isomerase/thioredoxin
MLLTKLKIATACCLGACVLAAGAGLCSYTAPAAQEPERTTGAQSKAEGAKEPPAPESKPRGDGQAETPPADKEVRGSGKAVTKEFQLADFTTIDVSRAFTVELTRAEAFRVAITADDNLLPHVQALKDGSVLRVSIDPNVKSFWATSLKATIAMPALDGLRVASGGKVTMKGFKSAKPFQAKVAFSGTLEGEIEAPSVDLDVAGGGRVTLKGSAKELKISAAQVCRLSLADLAVGRADVTLRDGATAIVNVKEKLDYDLSRACRLEYLGKPTATKGTTTDESMAVPVTSDPEKGKAAPQPGNPHHGHHGAGPAPVTVGAKVPDFALRSLDGKAVKLSELQKDAKRTNKGVVVFCFWCSTCSSCRRVEQPLDQLAKDYQGQALVVALDANAGETPENVRAFVKNKGLGLPIVLDPDGRTADLFGTAVTTTTVVIDGDGVLRYCGRFRGGDGHAYAEDALKAVLAGKEVAVKTTPHDG